MLAITLHRHTSPSFNLYINQKPESIQVVACSLYMVVLVYTYKYVHAYAAYEMENKYNLPEASLESLTPWNSHCHSFEE